MHDPPPHCHPNKMIVPSIKHAKQGTRPCVIGILVFSVQASLREVQVFTVGEDGRDHAMLTTTTTDISGEFCIMLALGEYLVKVRRLFIIFLHMPCLPQTCLALLSL